MMRYQGEDLCDCCQHFLATIGNFVSEQLRMGRNLECDVVSVPASMSRLAASHKARNERCAVAILWMIPIVVMRKMYDRERIFTETHVDVALSIAQQKSRCAQCRHLYG